MTMTDPIADMLTRVRNANSAYHDRVSMPSSKIKTHIAEILQADGSGTGTEEDFMGLLVMTLAGRAAEEVVLGDVSAGAATDLVAATRCAALMETRFGFSADYPLVSIGHGEDVDIARLPWLLRPVHDRLRVAYERALDLMRVERLALDRIARALVSEGHLEDPDVRALFAGPAPASRRRRARSAAKAARSRET